MSKQAQTVRELLASMEKHAVAAHKEVTKDEPETTALNEGFWMGVEMAHSKLDPILDAYIIPGASAVVTQDGLEKAAKALCDDMRDDQAEIISYLSWRKCPEDGRKHWRRHARAVLKAAGIRIEEKDDD